MTMVLMTTTSSSPIADKGKSARWNPLVPKRLEAGSHRPKARQPLTIQNRVTTKDIFKTISHESERSDGNPYGFKNYSLKYVLFHKPSGNYFKIDRSKYPQVITNEEAAKNPSNRSNHRDSSRVVFVDGFHQILHAGGPVLPKDGPVWVRLNGPVLWPLDFEKKKKEFTLAEEPILAHVDEINDFVQKEGLNPPLTKKPVPWQEMIRQLHEDVASRFTNPDSRQPLLSKKPLMMGNIIVRFTSLQPDGYTEDLDLFPTEDLPKLWAKKRLDLEA